MDDYVQQSGVKILAQPPEAEHVNILADIVFVHGLFGHWTETWTLQNSNGTSIFWPQDLLPSDFPNVRIMTYGYDADVAKLGQPVAQNSLHQNASNLLMYLALERQQTRTETRPIIFVCHSLGGLLVEDALVTSSNKAYMRYDDIANSTVGVIFMATPHFGADATKFARIISP
jgi:triacylglycerol esterase/lipase EstA (alpha/beta hydrolase family)